ncbi:hypothetical protein DFH27DRAFT_487991, partial [Peziza echinospora]
LSKVKIIVGDFNMVEYAFDRNPRHLDSPAVVAALREVLYSRGLHDGWLLSKESGTGHTYQSSNANLSTSRIDRVYIKKSVHHRCFNWDVVEMPCQYDHKGVTFDYHPRKRLDKGPGTWQLNRSYFKSSEYRDEMRVVIKTYAPAVTAGWVCATKEDNEGNLIDYWMEPSPTLDPEMTVKSWDKLIREIRSCAKN